MEISRARAWMADFAAQVSEHQGELTELDRQIGDADHGANLERGMRAVLALDADGFTSAPLYLKKCGMTLVSTVGGASGPLYGTLLLRFAGALDEQPSTAAELARAWRAGLEGVVSRGKAGLGDKTIVDALQPAVEAMEAATDDSAACLAAAVEAARTGRDATTALVARKGRASYLGGRSAGFQDPGATSVVLLLESAARTLA